MDASHPNLRAALDRLERATESGASGWRLLLYAFVLTPVAIAAPLFLFGADVGGDNRRPVLVGLMFASLALVALALYIGRRMRRDIRRELESSDIARRIAAGELLDDPIFDLTPWPWRLLLLRGRSDEAGQSLFPVLRRVAYNLDWYVRPPRRLWRWEWVYYPIAFLLAVALVSWALWINAPPIAGLPMNTNWTPPELPSLAILVGACLLLGLPFWKYERQICTEELVRHLRQRLDA